MQSVGMCPMCTSDDALVPVAVKPASTLVLMLLGEGRAIIASPKHTLPTEGKQ